MSCKKPWCYRRFQWPKQKMCLSVLNYENAGRATFIALMFFAAATVAFANPFKSKIITSSDSVS